MDLETFNNNFTTTVVRHEVYPAVEPYCYVVGFNVVFNTSPSKNMYIDLQVPFSKGIHEYNLIVEEAWENVYINIREWAQKVIDTNPALNSTFVPTEL